MIADVKGSLHDRIASAQMLLSWNEPRPWITAELPGIGGQIKQTPEDFIVEEIPAYLPSGEGEFIYLWIEKRDMGTDYFLRQMSQRLGIPRDEFGMAGLKDRHAVTRQWVSLPKQAESRIDQLEGDGIKVLQVSRHGNKLKPGHLHGNRFEITIREPDINHRKLTPSLIARIKALGMPNFYGDQRFGADGQTLQLGRDLLRGGTLPGNQRFLRKLALSAVQSFLFNRYLAQRMRDALLHTVIQGDVMAKYPMGGMFVVENRDTEQARFDKREIVSTGPMFGKKMKQASGEAALREQRILPEVGLRIEDLQGFGKLLQGTRRFNLVYPEGLEAIADDAAVRIKFALPAGSYATVLLDEIMKVKGDDLDESADWSSVDQDGGASPEEASS